jgi:hypothetical protein
MNYILLVQYKSLCGFDRGEKVAFDQASTMGNTRGDKKPKRHF